MKKLLKVVVLSGMLLSGCGSSTQPQNNQPEPTKEVSQEEKVLVVYFSATGNTKKVGDMIAAITGGDTYEILAKEEYASDDLNWHDNKSRTTFEQNDSSCRPEIGSEPITLEGYSKVYLGYPIWWGIAPRIMDTFVETYDFSGITVIPFCTSGSSGVGDSAKNLEELAGSGTWVEGTRLATDISEEELTSWIQEH